MLPASQTPIYVLRHQDTLGNINSHGAYPTVELAEAWMGHLIHEMLKERLLADVTEGKAGEINRLLAIGDFNEASEIFNDLQYALKMKTVWIEGVEFVAELPVFPLPDPAIS